MSLNDSRDAVPQIVFLDRNTIGPTVQLTRPRFNHKWIEYGVTAPDQVAERLAGARIAITNKAPLRRHDLAKLPNLKMIAATAIIFRFGSLARSWRRSGALLVMAIRAPASRSAT